jgi:uncharacterized membrane protein YcjF (UPF0283 family)
MLLCVAAFLLLLLQFLRGDRHAAGQALALARRHDLTAAAYSLSKRQAAAAWQSGQMAAALQWALQAHDQQLCAELVAPLIAKIQQLLLAQVWSLLCHCAARHGCIGDLLLVSCWGSSTNLRPGGVTPKIAVTLPPSPF